MATLCGWERCLFCWRRFRHYVFERILWVVFRFCFIGDCFCWQDMHSNARMVRVFVEESEWRFWEFCVAGMVKDHWLLRSCGQRIGWWLTNPLSPRRQHMFDFGDRGDWIYWGDWTWLPASEPNCVEYLPQIHPILENGQYLVNSDHTQGYMKHYWTWIYNYFGNLQTGWCAMNNQN